jgi:hypothetical protein
MTGWFCSGTAFVQVSASLVFSIVITPAIMAAIGIASERFEEPFAVGVMRLLSVCNKD